VSEEKLSEIMLDFFNAVEAACVQGKRLIGALHGVCVKEEAFLSLLGWSRSQGNRIGEFEFTTRKTNNNSDAFNHAYNILKINNASISNRFQDKVFQFGYWLFDGKPDTIYRQILRGK
jgi:hypothetical protein